jgi:hypothetical protein
MTAPSSWRELGGVRVAAAGAPGAYWYLPLAPSPQLGPDGAPAVGLLSAADAGFLQLTVQWDPPAAVLERLRDELATGSPVPVTLAPPPGLVVDAAALELDGETLAATRTSGFAPWTATFAVPLGAEALASAASALRGATGRLAVRFRARLDGAPADLRADAGSWIAGDRPDLIRVVATEAIGGLRGSEPPSSTPSR